MQNYLNYIKMGNFSKAVSEALNESERRNENLRQEIESLEFQKQNSFKAPPKEWIDHRLDRLRETLNKNTVISSLALKELLGVIRLEPIMDEKADLYWTLDCFVAPNKFGAPRNDGGGGFKPYYVAHTKIQTLALLDEERKGSNWLRWRRREDSNP